MFFDRFTQLCRDKGVSVYKACTDIGLNRSAVNKWKHGGQPNGSTLSRFAGYFGVPLDQLLMPASEKLSQPQGFDLALELDRLMDMLRSDEKITFDGTVMSGEAKKCLLSAIQLGIQAARPEK